MKIRRHRAVLLSSFLSLLSLTSFAKDSEVKSTLMKSQVSVLGGTYSLASDKKTLSGTGSALLSYQHYFTENFSASGGYSALFTKGTKSEISGFDVGLNYCFFSCTATTRSVGDLVSIKERGNWGLTLGAGISQRFFQLATATLTYSGMYGKAGVSYLVTDRFKILTEVQSGKLSTTASNITSNTFMIGIGMFFGSPSD